MSTARKRLIQLSPKGSRTELQIDGVVIAISPSERNAMVWAALMACFNWDEEDLFDAIVEDGIERAIRQNLQSEHRK